MNKEDAWMTTFTGKKFYPFDPYISDICIEDIAHHLALECRYGGACKYHYSVAQHCVLGARITRTELRIPFLLHDGAETYLKDMLHNLKRYMPEYLMAEKSLQDLIYLRFKVPAFDHIVVKRLDYAMMRAEVNVLMNSKEDWYFPEAPAPVTIEPWTWQEAEELFLDAYNVFS